eukprot:CAMPEP_0181514244 /NCGR_PEP_ID=MMETSP1110-20121109/62927_1 /TAXON_ID=174948 /ORGANISM="Symbiodinium sp., Strain CCMP421" /LENGTH=80 /DNA_ID=CAMNT_0023644161 /DNA_START=15 /DNA_END=255 /DNA_ORIENTATION=+
MDGRRCTPTKSSSGKDSAPVFCTAPDGPLGGHGSGMMRSRRWESNDPPAKHALAAVSADPPAWNRFGRDTESVRTVLWEH